MPIWSFTRTENQIAGLRDLCDVWQAVDTFWSFDEVLAALAKPGSLGFFAATEIQQPKWDGFILADVGPFSTDLLYVFVRPDRRGQNLGGQLMNALVTALSAKPNMEALFLEVRESNQPAQRLYERLGMQQVGKRARYYSNAETALVYKLDLGKTPEGPQ